MEFPASKYSKHFNVPLRGGNFVDWLVSISSSDSEASPDTTMALLTTVDGDWVDGMSSATC